MENDGQRRSLNVLFKLGADFATKLSFKFVVVSRAKPHVGLGGPWRTETLSVDARDEHAGRRFLLDAYLAADRRVKSIQLK